MKKTIGLVSLVSLSMLVGCTTNNAPIPQAKSTYIYTENDNFKSKRVDYLGYGLGGQGFGGYSVGGYGLVGYAGQMPGS